MLAVLLHGLLCVSGRPNATTEYLLELTSNPGGRPADAPVDFDCAWRAYAQEYATTIQPELPAAQQRAIRDALQLVGLCNATTDWLPATMTAAGSGSSSGGAGSKRQVYVDAGRGNDGSGTGALQAPFRTVGRALAASRAPAHGVADAPTITLRGGTYHMADTAVLTPADSGLTLAAFAGEKPTLSGGVPLDGLEWAPLPLPHNRLSGDHAAWRAAVDASALPAGIPALQIGGARMTRARFPNANPELDLFPAGYIPVAPKGAAAATATAWMAPRYNGTECTDRAECGKAADVKQPAPASEWHGMYQDYIVGVGGACDVYDPPYSPWCASSAFYGERWGGMHYRRPAGIVPGDGDLPHAPYAASTEKPVVHTWRPGHWYTWMFEVNGTTAGGRNLTFGRGGNQGGEGADAGAEWWIENVAEELDAPGEWFFDGGAGTLDLVHNGTGPPPTEGVVVPTLATLLELRGTQATPVTNVSVLGLTFTATRPTYFDPRANPSGGDWALERSGALMAEGVEGMVVRGCNFSRLDSNAISLNGYSRQAAIDGNHFEWLGQNAIASWGRSNFSDGTGGDFPRGTAVTGNIAFEVGIVQKQSSFYFQALTAEATISGNIVFNIPRAAINFNDGFGGGATVSSNLLFNTCRESSDHGAFNSWDRLPFLTTVRNGTASTIPAPNSFAQNFIVANYAADGGCLDTDDGSSYYEIRENFCVYGGHKADFDGHSKVSHHNIHAYPHVYGVACVNELQGLVKAGYAEGYTDNVCILPSNTGQYLRFNLDEWNGVRVPCDGSDLSVDTFHAAIKTGNNTIFVPGGSATIVCNHVSFNASDFMSGAKTPAWNSSRGYDTTSRVSGDVPSAAAIIAMAKALIE